MQVILIELLLLVLLIGVASYFIYLNLSAVIFAECNDWLPYLSIVLFLRCLF